MGSFLTLSIIDTEQNDIQVNSTLYYAECRFYLIVMLSVVMLNVAMLSVMMTVFKQSAC
jgi:hypothetical protein